MELFDYQSYHSMTKFLNMHDVILWHTKLVRSDADGRVDVKVAIQGKGGGIMGIGWSPKRMADIWQSVREDI